ncbi:MAG: hypothetical protein NVS3B18_15820 [Candidatus Dormibacteria bacterium]
MQAMPSRGALDHPPGQAHTRAVLVDLDVWAGDIYAGTLPQLCVFTGEPTRGVHSVRYSSFPNWVFALIFLGIAPFFVGFLLTRRTVTGTLPMCAKALRRFVIQRAARLVIVVVVPVACWVAAAAVIGSSADASGRLVAAGFAVLILGATACSIWGGAISLGGYVEDRPGWGRWVRLRGVDPAFAAAVQRLYAGRMPQWQIGTVPTSFMHYPLPAGYGPPQSPPGWFPPPWNASFPIGGAASPPQPPPAS